jgi:hypothetical protein
MVRYLHPKYPRRSRSFVFLLPYERHCSLRQATDSVSGFLSHTDIAQEISQPDWPPDPFRPSPCPCSSQVEGFPGQPAILVNRPLYRQSLLI